MAKANSNSPRKGGPVALRLQEPDVVILTPEIVSAEASKDGYFEYGSSSSDLEITGGFPGFVKFRFRILRLIRFFGRERSA